jgi:cobalt-zinc-cadmium resistance protein CzcA
LLSVEKQKFLPDLSLGYFNGSNQYAGSRNYQGFEIGLAIPLFFGEQKAKVKAGNFARQAALNLKSHYIKMYESHEQKQISQLQKYEEGIVYYRQVGKELSEELKRTALESFNSGEIDYFSFVKSMENAQQIELRYLEDLLNYNVIVLEINYLTI